MQRQCQENVKYGRPQGNINKKGNRDCLRSRPRAGQHQQKGISCFDKIETDNFPNFSKFENRVSMLKIDSIDQNDLGLSEPIH